jgi:hypothetical protein
MAGIGQIVPMADDTEILLESTANGIGNRFHKGVMDALKGKGDYELCFIPWFWQEEYRRAVPEGYAFEVADLDYQRDYGIDDEQLYWRRLKIDDDFSGDDSLFDQEYPASVALAFTAGTSKALIKPGPVARALRNHALPDNSTDALILGVDPAEYGDDDTAFVLRRGPKVLAAWTYSKEGNAEIAGRVALLIEKFKERDDPIDAVVIDVTGVGTGVEAFLSDAGYQNIYRMHNGAVAIEDEKYINRAAEGWSLMKEWFEDAHRHASLSTTTIRAAGCGWNRRSTCSSAASRARTSPTRWRSPSTCAWPPSRAKKAGRLCPKSWLGSVPAAFVAARRA